MQEIRERKESCVKSIIERGEYFSGRALVEKEGAIKLRQYAAKCAKLGSPWVHYDEMWERWEYLVMKKEHQQVFARSWERRTVETGSSTPATTKGGKGAGKPVPKQETVPKPTPKPKPAVEKKKEELRVAAATRNSRQGQCGETGGSHRTRARLVLGKFSTTGSGAAEDQDVRGQVDVRETVHVAWTWRRAESEVEFGAGVRRLPRAIRSEDAAVDRALRYAAFFDDCYGRSTAQDCCRRRENGLSDIN